MTETETVEVPWNSNRIYTIDYRFKDEPEDYICTAQVGVELDLPDEHPEEWSNEWVSFDCTIMQYFDKYSDFQACWDGKKDDTLDFIIVSVYLSKEQLFMHYAPCFNFEYDPDQLLDLALKKGFVTDTDNGYKINGNY
jgi:hypothetical protein